MNEKRGSWYLLTGVIIGVLAGLLFSLVLLPVQYADTDPSTLRAEDRDVYRGLIARAYLVEADAPRALARLALLQDPNQASVLVEQAQKLLAVGGSENQARGLALLAAALNQTTLQITPLPITLSSQAQAVKATLTLVGTVTPTMKSTRTPAATLTPRATPTLQPTQGAPYTLVETQDLCEPDKLGGLIEVYVEDAAGYGVAGVRVEVSLPSGGSEVFYTGLYPAINDGYADYAMLPGMVYNVRVGQTGELVLNLSIPPCENSAGDPYPGSIRLDFQQPN